MNHNKKFLRSLCFILISSVGGMLLSYTGLGIGWMLGTLIMAAILTFRQPNWMRDFTIQKGLPPYWLRVGQFILAIELGQKMNVQVIQIFSQNWFTITIMLLLSVMFSLLSGFFLWKLSQTDMLTSLFATAPGGIATMPSIAEEVGANTAVVSIIQTIRIFMVVLSLPLIASFWLVEPNHSASVSTVSMTGSEFYLGQLLGTFFLGLAAWVGFRVGKLFKFPAPVLVGGMLGVALLESFAALITGHEFIAWWPTSFMLLSQVFIASSIGSKFKKSMFKGIKRTILVAFFSTGGLILAMFACAFLVSKVTGISLITSVLTFAPGGVAEMAATAIVLGADSTFVVAVQVLRIVVVLLVLPPLFRYLYKWKKRKHTTSHAS
jgi:uncharacterized protein